MAPPAFDNDPGFAQSVEDLAIKQFVPKAGIEALHIAVLPRATRLDVRRLGARSGDPFLKHPGHELGTIIGSDVARNASQDEQVGQHVNDVDRLELAVDADRQALVRELVHHVEHAVFAAIMGAVLHEVVRPHMIDAFGPQPDAGAVRKPQTPAFGLLPGHLQPLPPPDPLHSAVADRPAGLAQQSRNLAIAITAVLASKLDDVGRQPFGIFPAPRDLALRRAVLPERRTDAALGDVQVLSDMLGAGAPTRGAQ